MHWYHAHFHGKVVFQVFGGAFGAFIIDDVKSLLKTPPSLKATKVDDKVANFPQTSKLEAYKNTLSDVLRPYRILCTAFKIRERVRFAMGNGPNDRPRPRKARTCLQEVALLALRVHRAEEAAAGPEAGARRRSSRGSVRKERGRVTLSCGQLAPPLAPHEGIVSAPPPPQLPAANAMQAAPLVTEPAPPLCQPRTPVGGPIHAQVGLPRSPPRSSQSSNLLTLESALEELVKELQSARIIGPGQGQ